MNTRKNGHPHRYPDTFIQFSGLAYTVLHMPYRQLEGFLQALSCFVPGLRFRRRYDLAAKNLEFETKPLDT